MAARSAKTDNPEARPSERWNGRFSITITLATAISLLVLVSVGSVLGVGVWLAGKNTLTLMSQNANQGIANAVERLEQHLIPAQDQARFIARRIEKGDVDPDDRAALGRLLTGALAGARQIAAVSFVDKNLVALTAGRREGANFEITEADLSRDAQIRKHRPKLAEDPQWVAPVWRKEHGRTYFYLVHPAWRGGTPIGAVASLVTVRELSAFVRKVGKADPGTRFILYGRDRVLAHPLMARGYPGLSVGNPLPRLDGFRDPVLAAMWQEEDRFDLLVRLAQGTNGHGVRIGGEDHVFMYRRLHGFGPKPLIVGGYFHTADIGGEIRRMIVSFGVGIAALVLAIAAAVLLGRRIARPIVRFSAAAGQVRDLNIGEIGDLPGSVFRELDQQAKSFNAMLRALRWFELYIPRKVVERLVKRGEIGDTISAAREITVMFTDIAGFSSVSENLSAPEVAAVVNRHFGIVAGCIEAEDGTVDKFIGDSVMAFWGAPDAQPDAADRACRAALAIAEGVRAENALRRSAGEAPLGIRIGIHSGSATVGNIGSPGRINYTIIGDAVNVGQRLEQLGKTLYPEGREAAILISGETAAGLGPDFAPKPAGRHRVKGRTGEVDVFTLGD